jgi:hypothetical protein
MADFDGSPSRVQRKGGTTSKQLYITATYITRVLVVKILLEVPELGIRKDRGRGGFQCRPLGGLVQQLEQLGPTTERIQPPTPPATTILYITHTVLFSRRNRI